MSLDAALDHALAERILRAFYRVYDTLGHGFLEAVYSRALAIELRLDGLHVEREVTLEVWYRGEMIGIYRADQVVERRIVLELKATPIMVEAHRRQLLNALNASGLQSGLALNFGERPRFWRVIGRERSDK